MIVGVDESNFSPSLAGDCVVCALTRTGEEVEGVASSKALSPKKRLELFAKLQKHSLYYVVPATPNSISDINIYLARNAAVMSAVAGLLTVLTLRGTWEKPEKVLIDGYWSEKWREVFSELFEVPVEGIVRGDETVYEISAASIIAKCYCDALFAGWERLYPNWGIGCDHGSLSDKHLAEIRARGPSPLHRVGKYAPDWWNRIFTRSLKRDAEENANTH